MYYRAWLKAKYIGISIIYQTYNIHKQFKHVIIRQLE